jgi:hypothetical protein
VHWREERCQWQGDDAPEHRSQTTLIFTDFCCKIVEILASKVEEGPKKVKGVLHWVSSPSPSVVPRKATLRMCAPLLLHLLDECDRADVPALICPGMTCSSRAKTPTSARTGWLISTPAAWMSALAAPHPACCTSRTPRQVVQDALIEESLEAAPVGSRFQFERVA